MKTVLTSKSIPFSELGNKKTEHNLFIINQEKINICLTVRELQRVTVSSEENEHLANSTVQNLNADSEKIAEAWRSVTAQYRQEGLFGLPCILLYYLYDPQDSDLTMQDMNAYNSSSSHLLVQNDDTVVWASSEQEIYDDDNLAFISAEGFLEDKGDILFFHNCNALQPIVKSPFCKKFSTHFFRTDTIDGSVWRKVII
ncbi:hypothetical protein [Endozoicomonas sp. OPT23]|uniref:hypothetical protein n=1 Tax=Endozoicomonas sp. OPT23 TaxID=2072845 RepID=UPI00129B85CF|nr:hypothetical protein [Endozoicomonas sp. OPT23]